MVSETNLGSKTIWGFGLAIIIGIAQTFGVASDPGTTNLIAEFLQGAFSILGIWGTRDALRY